MHPHRYITSSLRLNDCQAHAWQLTEMVSTALLVSALPRVDSSNLRRLHHLFAEHLSKPVCACNGFSLQLSTPFCACNGFCSLVQTIVTQLFQENTHSGL